MAPKAKRSRPRVAKRQRRPPAIAETSFEVQRADKTMSSLRVRIERPRKETYAWVTRFTIQVDAGVAHEYVGVGVDSFQALTLGLSMLGYFVKAEVADLPGSLDEYNERVVARLIALGSGADAS